MNIFRLLSWVGAAIIVALLALTACKPKPTADHGNPGSAIDDRPVSTDGSASHPPTVNDLAGFLRSSAPPFARVADVRMDPPTPMPNSSPANRSWVFNVRFAFVPTEDLLGPAPEADARAYQAVSGELSGWIRWHDAYTKSPYVRLYSGFDLNLPAIPPAGQTLLAILHKAGATLPPIYGKMAAEWQVDHWRFSAVDLDIPEAGVPRSTFQASNVVLGSPEAEAFLQAARDAVAQTSAKKAAIDASYTADLAKATRPGTLYKGQIIHLGSVVPAEVRFLPSPTDDPQAVGLEVRLPATPGEVFVYSAHLAKQVPVRLAVPEGPINPIPTTFNSEPLPKGDLKLSLVSASGKEGVYNETVPVRMLFVQRHYQPVDVWLHLFNNQLEGGFDGDGSSRGGCVLTARQTP